MTQTTTRVYIDCRDFPSESGCSLRISGSPDEVLTVAATHAVAGHGHADEPALRDQLAGAIRPEAGS
jgi:hypothetical protein